MNIIIYKSSETYFYSDKSHNLLPLSDIPNLVRDKKYYKNNDITFEYQLKKEIKEWLHLQLNKRDRNLGIQSSNTTLKRFYQNRLIKPALNTWQPACIKNKIPISVNIICSIFTIFLISKSHIYIVIILANLSTRYDNSSPNEPLFFKKAMLSLY